MKLMDINPRLSRDFPREARYLIGVSGGRDSVALLHWLVNLGYRKLILCHLNHHLRGRSSLADARFVEKIAGKYRAELELESANVRAFATKRKMSIETAARDSRYSFFAKVAKRRRCHTIFLAHHADDLVETFLINLFRGAGSAVVERHHLHLSDHAFLPVGRTCGPVVQNEWSHEATSGLLGSIMAAGSDLVWQSTHYRIASSRCGRNG